MCVRVFDEWAVGGRGCRLGVLCTHTHTHARAHTHPRTRTHPRAHTLTVSFFISCLVSGARRRPRYQEPRRLRFLLVFFGCRGDGSQVQHRAQRQHALPVHRQVSAQLNKRLNPPTSGLIGGREGVVFVLLQQRLLARFELTHCVLPLAHPHCHGGGHTHAYTHTYTHTHTPHARARTCA